MAGQQSRRGRRKALVEARRRGRERFNVTLADQVTVFILSLLAGALQQADAFDVWCAVLWEIRRVDPAWRPGAPDVRFLP